MTERIPSLFIVSLPRSLSTIVYEAACIAVGLERPRWTEAGEILNLERTPLVPWDRKVETAKFSPDDGSPRAAQLHAFLDDVVAPEGRAYKDVVQPFIVAGWLRSHPLRVLRVRRPVAEVAWSMQRHGWMYPAAAAGPNVPKDRALVDGLRRAAQALDGLDAVPVDYADLVRDEGALTNALRALYDGFDVQPARYIDQRFRQRARDVAASLESPEGRAFVVGAESIEL